MTPRVLGYGRGIDAPRNDGASAWWCCWLSIASLVLIVTLFAGKLGSISYGPALAAVTFSAVCAVVATVFGVRCFWRRERHRGIAIFGFLVLLPTFGGHFLLMALFFGFIGVPA